MEAHDAIAWLLWLLGIALIAAGTFLVRRYGPLVRAQREYELLRLLVSLACGAAEQLGESRSWTGDTKKQFAREVIRAALDRIGIVVSDVELDAAIEATVRELDREGSRS